MGVVLKLQNWVERVKKSWRKTDWGEESRAFTLPEVIVSFSILILVITSATGILVTVMRSNADNVNTLVAYGLAQEGVEAMRFVRDSNAVLGLGFDGGVAGSTATDPDKWGAKLFEANPSGAQYFAVDWNNSIQQACDKKAIGDCLPVKLRKLDGEFATLQSDSSTMVYKTKKTEADSGAVIGANFLQAAVGNAGDGAEATNYHRMIRVEPLMVSGDKKIIDALRVSSIVSWKGQNDKTNKVVVTTDLTNWK